MRKERAVYLPHGLQGVGVREVLERGGGSVDVVSHEPRVVLVHKLGEACRLDACLLDHLLHLVLRQPVVAPLVVQNLRGVACTRSYGRVFVLCVM
jgi:hypothetical protein